MPYYSAGARASFEPHRGETPAGRHLDLKPGHTRPAGGSGASPPGPLNATARLTAIPARSATPTRSLNKADPRAAAGVTSSTRCDRNRGDGFGVAGGVRSGRGPLAALVLVVLLAAGCAPAGAAGLSLAACGTPASNSPGATASASSSSGLTEIPDETNGPYPADGTNGPDILEDSGVIHKDI